MQRRKITVKFEYDLDDLEEWVGEELSDAMIEWVYKALDKYIPNIVEHTMKSLFESEYPALGE